MTEADRIKAAIQCTDSNSIPKVPRAGEIVTTPSETYQIMHNGLEVLIDSHYGAYNTEVIKLLHGHHEPQEELAFYEVLKLVPQGATMLELGSFWAYYSLWFLKAVHMGKAILVEPLESALDAGRRNFVHNHEEGTFIRAAISNRGQAPADIELWPGMSTNVAVTTVDQIIQDHGVQRLNILHSDIQGAEVRMLQGAAKALSTGIIDWIFISTHGENIHQRCLQMLKQAAYAIVADHTPGESYSVDGLIVASSTRHGLKVNVSRRRSYDSVKAKLRAAIRVRVLEPLRLKSQTI